MTSLHRHQDTEQEWVGVHCIWPCSSLFLNFYLTQLLLHSAECNSETDLQNGFVWVWGGGHLAGEQLGSLEHNTKVNDLNIMTVTLSWNPWSLASKSLHSSSVTSHPFLFPSPQVCLTTLSVFCWLNSSVLSPHFHFPYLSHFSIRELLSQCVQRPQQRPGAIIKYEISHQWLRRAHLVFLPNRWRHII